MLQSIHDKAKGWVAYLIVGFISVPFALWGIHSYLGGGGEKIAATVNGEDIPSALVQNELLQLKQQFAQIPGFDDQALKSSAVERVISRTLLQQHITEEGYRASNSEVLHEIKSIPAFQVEGKFNVEQYKATLESLRRNEAVFENEVRNDIAMKQFQNSVNDTVFLTKEEAATYQSLRTQQREIELLTVKLADFSDKVVIGDEQITEYYEKNKSLFMTPERLKVAYIELNRDEFAQTIEVDEQEIQDYYDQNADRYVVPERRTASHIVIAIDSPDKENEAQKKAESLYQAISSGKRSFEDVAKTDSVDTLSADKGGDLGVIAASDWGKAFNEAVFSLANGELSKPVKTQAGYEIIKVTGIESARQKELDEVKEQVKQDLRSEQASEWFQNKDDELPTLAYENETDLQPVADSLGVALKTSDWFTRMDGDGIAARPNIRDIAFSEELKAHGSNSEKLDLAEGYSLVFRVTDQEQPIQKSLEEVKPEIESLIKDSEMRKQVNEKGNDWLAKLQSASSWNPIASESIEIKKLGWLDRKSSATSAQNLEKAFAMTRPVDGALNFSQVLSPNGDYNIIALRAVKDGDSVYDESILRGFNMYLNNREQQAMIQALREAADVEIFSENF